MRGDLHIHSKYSYDSLMKPYQILKLCRKLGFDVISITDHDTIKGSLAAKKYEKEFGIEVLIGEERKTNYGDIIGLNLNEKLKGRNCMEVLEEIKDQGGISIFPHPYRGHKNIEDISKHIDIIETFNSRNHAEANNRALNLAKNLKKPCVSGSDAHIYSEIGNSVMVFDDLYGKHKEFSCTYSSKKQKVESYLIKDIKLKKIHKVPLHLMRLFY
ncbi:PHP domain-containing protein [Methanohalophilus sp. DAL1]|uniref:PHP domain-containing protein n=1 Tax=Methanohalophilus sp. DAL1 TaxID=1864608 RepID=UPI0025C26AD5|nr:PHP domain-containing protein [Methanohalophilus sp. DAL1]